MNNTDMTHVHLHFFHTAIDEHAQLARQATAARTGGALSSIIIHSKYFPVSDWLKARLNTPDHPFIF